MDTLSAEVDSLALGRNYVAFVPSDSSHEWNVEPEPIPRYLFRVFDSTSPGESNGTWIRSKNAVRNPPDGRVDLFSRSDRSRAARRLWDHLKFKNSVDDNLMSWTSSLLFAIRYIFYRHNQQWERPPYADIRICVLDTEQIGPGAFIRDLDIIRAFAPYDDDLMELQRLRRGKYYFSEYLSQGALEIAGHNAIVFAQDMISQGLLSLRPEFETCCESCDGHLAKDVVAMYAQLRPDSARAKPFQARESVSNAINVSLLFGRRYRLHVAMSLLAIVPGQIDVGNILQAFREQDISIQEILNNSQAFVDQGTSDLVRMREVQGLLRAECYQRELQDCLATAQFHVGRANDVASTLIDERTDNSQLFISVSACEREVEDMLSRLQELRELMHKTVLSL